MIHLVTDSTAGLPGEIRNRWQIETISLKVTLGERSVDEDKVDLAGFYRLIERSETTPTTSQPAPAEFADLYGRLTQNGDEVLAIHISGALSGTVQVATTVAAELAPERITIVDSRSTTCGLAMMVQAAARALERGATRQQAAALVQRMASSYAGIFILQSLDYVAKGGRIGGAARFLGNVLHLTPVLCMNDGRVDALSVARTRKRGLQTVLDEVEKRVGRGPIYGAVTHILCPEDAQAAGEQIRRRFDVVDFFINQTSPAIGCHSGPGFLGFTACPYEA